MVNFFLARPVLSWVTALFTILIGFFSFLSLPINQYPNVAFPQVAIFGSMPGASTKTIEETVIQVIERQMKGLENLVYMTSSSDNTGNVEMIFSFENGTDIAAAQVQVQNKLQQAMPMLPEEVKRYGLQVMDAAENSFMLIVIYDESGKYTNAQLNDYAASNVIDRLSRVSGVGKVEHYGSEAALRIWLDPFKMERYKKNPEDIVRAVQEQNTQSQGGQIGARSGENKQKYNISIAASERLGSVEEFENIQLKTVGTVGSLKLGQLSNIEISEENFFGSSTYQGHLAAVIALKLSSKGNVIETSQRVVDELNIMAKAFPPGISYALSDERAPIVKKSIASVRNTLLETVLLVAAVLFLFLQKARATVIPMFAIPVVLAGVCVVLKLLGFSINTLTLFGMVLAVGLMVDDAIVVVENVERIVVNEGLSVYEATKKTMKQLSSALIGVGVAVSAVFLPLGFVEGSLGIIYRQFAVTLVSAMFFSVLVALFFTPTLCMQILNKEESPTLAIFKQFNISFSKFANWFCALVRSALLRPARSFAAFVLLLSVSFLALWFTPSAFLPQEDTGMIYAGVQLPPLSPAKETKKQLKDIEDYFNSRYGNEVKDVITVEGWGFDGNGQNNGMVFITLKDWAVRNHSTSEILEEAQKHFSENASGEVFFMSPPAIMELGNSSGFDFQLLDQGGKGRDFLRKAKDALLTCARKDSRISDVRYEGLPEAETYKFSLDQDRAAAHHLTQSQVDKAISSYWAGEYINDFSYEGRNKKVIVRAHPKFLESLSDLSSFSVRNMEDKMVPLPSVLNTSSEMRPQKVTRYQGYPSMKITGEGTGSSSEAMAAMESCFEKLEDSLGFQWSGLSLQEVLASGQVSKLYLISAIVIFLCLAALYESWSVPFAVLICLPTGVAGTVLAGWLLGMHKDIYFQLSILTVFALQAKNSILIVEFALQALKEGRTVIDALVDACRFRIRPIIMTSLCFTLGILPLVFASGASAGAQNSLGKAIFFGMMTSTTVGVLFAPLCFLFVSLIRLKIGRNNKLSMS